MYLKRLDLHGFKSFAKKGELEFNSPITAVVGPNGSGKSNIAESIRFVLGEQSIKSLRSKKGEDLIFNGSKAISQMNRASVSIVFDNSKKVFSLNNEMAPNIDLNFDEIVISREVYRDGTNRYLINGTQVRLRDIMEILSSVNIGATGHHIISQGEADRILNANTKERREMIEEALGLKIYQWKIAESEKKLVKTEENIEKAESLRREISPHLKFLKKQVEKIEKAQILRDELTLLYNEYLKKEEEYLKRVKEKNASEKAVLREELDSIDSKISEIKKQLSLSQDNNEKIAQLSRQEEELRKFRNEKEDLSRKIGRLEGVIEYEERRAKEVVHIAREDAPGGIPLGDIEIFADEIKFLLRQSETKKDFFELRVIVGKMRDLVNDFVDKSRKLFVKDESREKEILSEVETLKTDKASMESRVKEIEEREKEALEILSAVKNEIELEKDKSRDSERYFYELTAKKSEVSSRLDMIISKENGILMEEENFLRELKEASVLIGTQILRYKEFVLDLAVYETEPRTLQDSKRREIERIKIRLEDMGGVSQGEVLREYQEVEERDKFLEKEIEDLRTSAESLKQLMDDLKKRLDSQFSEGVVKINSQFNEFFALMFNGGNAMLALTEEKKRPRSIGIDNETGEEIFEMQDEEEEVRKGIDIKVNLPQKKIRDLQMLSGGERALTSIALLFAISQVNPPPFLVLDETDAALDEANSRKYGDMLENLSKYSQLMVITHNRETMSRAGTIYGITTSGDAASKLLSIKFEEASVLAK